MILSKKELADMCNMPTNALAVYIQRKQIHVENDTIDSNHPVNIKFISKKQEKKPNPIKKVKPKVVKVAPKIEQKAKPEPSPMEQDQDEPTEITSNSLLDIEIEMQKAKLRRQINGDKKEKIIISKLQGQLVEVDIVEKLVTEVGRSITHEFRAVLDNFLTQFAFKYNIDATEVSTQRKHGIFVLNKAYEDSIENVKKKIDAIIEDLEG